MRKKAVAMLGVACVMGGASVWLAQNWLERQTSNVVAEAPRKPEREMTTVVVARLPMGFGAQLSHENLREVPWPADAVPDGSFRSIRDLLGDERRVVLREVQPNEIMLRSRVSGYGGRATLSAVVAEGRRAVTIRVNDVMGVAGFVLPGDHVDVFFTRPMNPQDRNGGQRVTDVLLQNVKVLAVDQVADDNKTNPVLARAVTLEVASQDGQKLALASEFGALSLSLRKLGNAEAEPAGTVTFADLVAYRPAADDAVEAADWRPSYSVHVVRGVDGVDMPVDPEPPRAEIPAPPAPAAPAPAAPQRKVAALPEPETRPVGRPMRLLPGAAN